MIVLFISHGALYNFIVIYILIINLCAGNLQGAADSLLFFEYGLQVFDLCVDQICQLMEKPNINIGTLFLPLYTSLCNQSAHEASTASP